jgi:hypothetical protein
LASALPRSGRTGKITVGVSHAGSPHLARQRHRRSA